MSPLLRFGLPIKAWLSALLAPAEDPRESFATTAQRQQELLARVRRARADVSGMREQLEARARAARDELAPFEVEARRALAGGREDLARLALRRRQVALVALRQLDDQVREIRREEDRLSLVEQRLAAQIDAFATQQKVTLARYNAAEAQVRITEALAAASRELSDLGLALQETAQKAERMQARASALDSLVVEDPLAGPVLPAGDHLERQLDQLEIAQAVEEQLAGLKQELGDGKSPAPKAHSDRSKSPPGPP
jgi:phage shock protein A